MPISYSILSDYCIFKRKTFSYWIPKVKILPRPVLVLTLTSLTSKELFAVQEKKTVKQVIKRKNEVHQIILLFFL